MKIKRIATEEDLYAAFDIRKEVFVEEQGIPLADEFDEFDDVNGQCEHILVYNEDKPVGTGRIRFVEGIGKLERICILKEYRKFGLGRIIISELEKIAGDKGVAQVKLHGQTQAEGFYHKLSYRTASGVFMEDGLPHVKMLKELHHEELNKR